MKKRERNTQRETPSVSGERQRKREEEEMQQQRDGRKHRYFAPQEIQLAILTPWVTPDSTLRVPGVARDVSTARLGGSGDRHAGSAGDRGAVQGARQSVPSTPTLLTRFREFMGKLCRGCCRVRHSLNIPATEETNSNLIVQIESTIF